MEKRISNDGNEHCQNRAGTDRILLSGIVSIVIRGSEMGWVESIQKAIEYIEEHLLEDLTIENISRQANASAFHFQRTFTILTDITIGDYIRRRRLTLAAQEISSTNGKVIDLAYKYGYDTPRHSRKLFEGSMGYLQAKPESIWGS